MSPPLAAPEAEALSAHIVPGAVTFQDRDAMTKMSSASPVGTLAYIIEEEALLVRVNSGWQYIAVWKNLYHPFIYYFLSPLCFGDICFNSIQKVLLILLELHRVHIDLCCRNKRSHETRCVCGK